MNNKYSFLLAGFFALFLFGCKSDPTTTSIEEILSTKTPDIKSVKISNNGLIQCQMQEASYQVEIPISSIKSMQVQAQTGTDIFYVKLTCNGNCIKDIVGGKGSSNRPIQVFGMPDSESAYELLELLETLKAKHI